MMEDCGERLAGQYVEDANKTVTMWLDENDALLKLQFIKHSYPHDWRTKNQLFSVQPRSGLLPLTRSETNFLTRSTLFPGFLPGVKGACII